MNSDAPDQSYIPAITPAEMANVDRLMIEKYGISLVQMMENAGRNLALLAKRLLKGSMAGKDIVIVTGPGNNGGGGMVAARHLHNFGAEITLLDVAKRSLSGVPAQQRKILENMGINIIKDIETLQALENRSPDCVIDAMIGYSLFGAPRGLIRAMIEKISQLNTFVISLDVPTGIDADTGDVFNPSIKANATMTLALPKTGLFSSKVKNNIGRLFLADISVPPLLYKEIGWEVGPLFAEYPIIELKV